MIRTKAVTTLLIMVVTLVASYWGTTRVVSAEPPRSDQIAVVITDGVAIRASRDGVTLTRTFMELVATLQNDQSLAFISDEEPSTAWGPYSPKLADFDSILDQIQSNLYVPTSLSGGDLADALANAHTLLGNARASAGSSIYLITGSSPQTDFRQLSQRISPLVARIKEAGWPVHGISLPGASRESLEFLNTLSNDTGGEVFELSVADGFKKLADAILRKGAKGTLSPVSSRIMTPNDLLTSTLSVKPGTREITLLFFREKGYGSLRLSNPSGLEVSAGDRTASYVVETPQMVIWRLVEPTPGNWKIDARGMEGLISAWEYSDNQYSLVLKTQSPLPLHTANTLVGYVTDGRGPVVLKNVSLLAGITTPAGTTLVNEMKDDGSAGDAKAGDGYFSMILPPLEIEGEYHVTLELTWLEYNHKISSEFAFKSQPFPALNVQSLQVEGLQPGNRVKVAVLSVHVDGTPYPVDSDKVVAMLAEPEDQKGTLELEPRRLFGNGPAWQYDVYFTPKAEALHSLAFQLSLEYAGRTYTQTSESIVLSSVKPPPAFVPTTQTLPTAPPVTQRVEPARQPLSPQPILTEESGFPWALVIFPILALVAIATASAYLATRVRPYGYLYNDNGEPLVDFAAIKRHPVVDFLFRSLVRGNELNLPGLEGVAFQFAKNRISIRSYGEHPTIRVNNQPLIDNAPIQDRTWIGTGGKLYTFLVSPTRVEAAAGAD